MKDIEIKKSFNRRFCTLGDYFTADYSNVNFNNNVAFVIPADKKFFSVSLKCNPPSQIGIASDGKLERINGFYQIDICQPLNVGTALIDEITNKVFELFAVGTTFDDVTVTGCYCADGNPEADYYKQIVRVVFDADIVNE